jgi:hypothetical protein
VLSLGPSPPATFAMASRTIRESCGAGIFSDTSRRGTVDPGSPRTIRRLRRVEIDMGRLFPGGLPPSAARAADRVALNLFPDVCVVAIREQAMDLGPGKVQWIGRAQGTPPGTVTLVIDDALAVGTVMVDRRVFQISFVGDGVHAVAEIDQSAFPRD